MQLLKSFKHHGAEIKIFSCWENDMRVVISDEEDSIVSFTCPYDSLLENSEKVKVFLSHYFNKKNTVA